MSIVHSTSFTTSGVTGVNLTVADAVLECFERIQIYSSQVSTEMVQSFRRSANIVLQDWSGNRGVNLWAVDQISIPMIVGVSQYPLPPDTVQMLDTYMRRFQIGSPVNQPISVSTTALSKTVTINWPANGLSVGEYFQIIVPIAVGGLVLQGFYPVVSTPSANAVTITAQSYATSTVSDGGVVPVFSTIAGSNVVSVYLPNHGLLAGQPFNVQVSTICGGFNLYGGYTVATVPSTNSFTFLFSANAYSTATATENGGMAQYGAQVQNSQPTDIIMYPLSRNDWAMLPNKFTQGQPTTYWFDRQLQPVVNVWEVPDDTQPYLLIAYRMRQLQYAAPSGYQTLDLPGRFFEAFCAELTAKMAEKWAPTLWADKMTAAQAAWDRASLADVEAASTFVQVDMTNY